MKVIKEGIARYTVLYSDGFYLLDNNVRIYESGIVEIENPRQHMMVHLTNCEIVWRDDVPDAEHDSTVIPFGRGPKGVA
jgi:hypothetical protein